MNEQDRQIADTIERERGRLRNFIRKRVPDRQDAEDVLQDVFFELVEAYRLVKPIVWETPRAANRGRRVDWKRYSTHKARRILAFASNICTIYALGA